MALDLGVKDLLSPATALVGTIGAVWAVVRTLHANRESQKTAEAANRKSQESAQAFAAYDAYLKDSFDHPRFANGQLVNQLFEMPDHYKDGSDAFYKYEWFVARLMSAAEQILAVVSGDLEWKAAIKTQVKKHFIYIESQYFQAEIYSCQLRKIIEEVKAERKALGKP